MQAARIRLPDGRISWTVLDAEHETVESARAWLLHLENIHMAPNTVERFAKHVAALGLFLAPSPRRSSRSRSATTTSSSRGSRINETLHPRAQT
jgi:hypothetical protein